MIPIPKNLLIHNISYYAKNDDIRYDGGFADPIEVKHVLINTSTSYSPSKGKKYVTKMIIDAYNSRPMLKPAIQSKVVFEGKELIITNIKEVNDNLKLHHYEVDLT